MIMSVFSREKSGNGVVRRAGAGEETDAGLRNALAGAIYICEPGGDGGRAVARMGFCTCCVTRSPPTWWKMALT